MFTPSLGNSTTLWVKQYWPWKHLPRAPCESNVEFVQQSEFAFFAKAASSECKSTLQRQGKREDCAVSIIFYPRGCRITLRQSMCKHTRGSAAEHYPSHLRNNLLNFTSPKQPARTERPHSCSERGAKLGLCREARAGSTYSACALGFASDIPMSKIPFLKLTKALTNGSLNATT